MKFYLYIAYSYFQVLVDKAFINPVEPDNCSCNTGKMSRSLHAPTGQGHLHQEESFVHHPNNQLHRIYISCTLSLDLRASLWHWRKWRNVPQQWMFWSASWFFATLYCFDDGSLDRVYSGFSHTNCGVVHLQRHHNCQTHPAQSQHKQVGCKRQWKWLNDHPPPVYLHLLSYLHHPLLCHQTLLAYWTFWGSPGYRSKGKQKSYFDISNHSIQHNLCHQLSYLLCQW